MKTILLLLCILLAVPALAQKPAVGTKAVTPFKNANTIVVQTSDSAGVALRKMGTLLVQAGYTIKKADYEYNTLVTDPRPLTFGFRPVLTIKVVATPTGLKMTGEQTTDMAGLGMSSTPSMFAGMETSVYKGTFREIEKVAKSYPGAAVSYLYE